MYFVGLNKLHPLHTVQSLLDYCCQSHIWNNKWDDKIKMLQIPFWVKMLTVEHVKEIMFTYFQASATTNGKEFVYCNKSDGWTVHVNGRHCCFSHLNKSM
jgi:hypothetical protein